MFHQSRVTIFTKLNRWAFKNTACLRQGLAQLDMRLHIAGKSADIVNNDNNAVFGMQAQERQHPIHCGAALKLP
ncbi:hypothetical protein AB838_00330 [Rhodobacteraceae bacterium (ex Bugula neritina AB1)]|nr:hypothetical protein AB838_00330 [Rhodobacteraceae bacterium (ex Bugula neritina AB1)]